MTTALESRYEASSGSVSCRILLPSGYSEDWRWARCARREALQNSPAAFVVGGFESMASDEQWRSLYDQSVWVLARSEADQAVGLLKLTVFDDRLREGYIEGVWVHPDFRCGGVARQMMETARVEAASRKLSNLRLAVLNTNAPMVNVFVRLGFEPVVEGPGDVETELTRTTTESFTASR